MTHADTQVQLAIEESIRENRTVAFSARLDSQEWIDLSNSLYANCDDSSDEHTEDGLLRKYWGEDDDGDKWSVSLLGAK